MNEPLNILMIEGNTQALNRALDSCGLLRNGVLYADVLCSIDGSVQITHCLAADEDVYLPEGVALSHFDGAVLGGSALRAHADSNQPEVRRQIELAKALFREGVPFLGSCWGLQLAAVAAGGTVQASPRGREVGISRNLRLSPAGRAHPFYQDKADVFSQPCIHYDEVTHLPTDAVVLASNDHSSVQAAVIRQDGGEFWGVQYHPEFDLARMAGLYKAYGEDLIAQGFFADATALNSLIDDFETLHAQHQRSDLAWRYGIGKDVLDNATRMREIENWLRFVRRRKAAA